MSRTLEVSYSRASEKMQVREVTKPKSMKNFRRKENDLKIQAKLRLERNVEQTRRPGRRKTRPLSDAETWNYIL